MAKNCSYCLGSGWERGVTVLSESTVCRGCNGTGEGPKAPKAPKAFRQMCAGCARCGDMPVYGGGLCKRCAKSFGTWL